MKIIIDNRIIKLVLFDPVKIATNTLIFNPNNQIQFRWPSLLEYLDLGSLFTNLPAFDQEQPLFRTCLTALHSYEEKDVLFYMYDRLFAETLSGIKNLQQIQSSYLLNATAQHKKNASESEKIFFSTLTLYEKSLTENASYTMHDLILYLAWDRMCVYISRLFDYQSSDIKFIEGLEVLKECLIESYLHISLQGRTSPSIYRLFESLFFYFMREEKLQEHSSAEWAILSQSFRILKNQEELVDFFYIDHAFSAHEELSTASECYMTLDSPEVIKNRLDFVH